MLLIITGHMLKAHGYGDVWSTDWYINIIAKGFTCVGVNVFVLISGYFGIKLRVKKLMSLNNNVTFYSIAFLAIALAFSIHDLNLRKDWMQLFPVITKQYWFITIYFALCLISPLLNRLIDNLTKQEFQKLLGVGLAMFYILPTIGYILNFPSITVDFGYGIVNFIYLYLLGRYIRLHYKERYPKTAYLAMYIISGLFLSGFCIGYSYILGFYFNTLISYDSIPCLVGALSLFLYFKNMSFQNKLINALASTCLIVYVIHENPIVSGYIWHELIRIKDYEGPAYLLLLAFGPSSIFIICSILDIMRHKLLKVFKLE